MIEVIITLTLILVAITLSGFFLWAGLRIIGKKVGIVEAGLVNLAGGFFAVAVGTLFTIIPFFGLLSPLAAYVVYLYVLKALLDITFFEAFISSILASIVFLIVSFVLAIISGVVLIKLFPYVFNQGWMRF
jgi:hypothetical protein